MLQDLVGPTALDLVPPLTTDSDRTSPPLAAAAEGVHDHILSNPGFYACNASLNRASEVGSSKEFSNTPD